MKNLTIKNIAQACGGEYHGDAGLLDRCVESITSDSRKTEKDCLFIPIVGARADGHTFIPQVMGQGALCTLSERDLGETDVPYIRVESSLQAVKDIAAFYLEQLQIPVVGITGSVGKTSTKEMVSAVLSQKFRVLKTQGNFNNELGLPLTIFRLREKDQIAVLEMGISDFEEMHRLAAIAKPDTCVITNIGYCHLENLKSLDGVLKAKTEIFDHLKKDGRAVLNGDDGKLSQIREVGGQPPVFYGLQNDNGIYADHIKSMGLKGISCEIHDGEDSIKVLIPTPGIHMVYNALAGTAVGKLYGLSLEEIKAGIESLEPLTGRFNIIETEDHMIIDDCYNANPISMKASLGILKEAEGRKVAILGDMGELGENEIDLHREVGEAAGESKLQLLICAGPLSRHLAEAAKTVDPSLEVVYFSDRESLQGRLPDLIKKGDTILVKASHFMQYEKIVEQLR